MAQKRSHTGIAEAERKALGLPEPVRVLCAIDPDPSRKVCRSCGRKVMYVRRSYGPHGKAGRWQHVGDGLAQYRGWR